MYQHEPLFLNPEFKDRLWGGTKLTRCIWLYDSD